SDGSLRWLGSMVLVETGDVVLHTIEGMGDGLGLHQTRLRLRRVLRGCPERGHGLGGRPPSLLMVEVEASNEVELAIDLVLDERRDLRIEGGRGREVGDDDSAQLTWTVETTVELSPVRRRVRQCIPDHVTPAELDVQTRSGRAGVKQHDGDLPIVPVLLLLS